MAYRDCSCEWPCLSIHPLQSVAAPGARDLWSYICEPCFYSIEGGSELISGDANDSAGIDILGLLD